MLWRTKRGRVHVHEVTHETGRWFYTLVDENPIEDPACMRDEDDPMSAFAQYLLPRLRQSRDEASREVLRFMEDGASISDAVIYTIKSLSTSKTKRLRVWVSEATSTRIYPFVEIAVIGNTRSKEVDARVDFGLQITMSGSPSTGAKISAVVAREKAEAFKGVTLPWDPPFMWGLEMTKKLDAEMDRLALKEADTWFTAASRGGLGLGTACATLRKQMVPGED